MKLRREHRIPGTLIAAAAIMLTGTVGISGNFHSAAAAAPCGTVTTPPARYSHVIWIWMENKTFPAVINNAAAPYTTSLAKSCTTDSHWNDAGGAYNSEPNYMAMTTGLSGTVLDKFKCDCAPSSTVNTTANNIFRQVRTAGKSERSYEEGMGANCSNTGTSYAPKHNPAAYMWGGTDRTACKTDDIPMGSTSSGALITALANNTLPTFAAITPNLCHDMHDCSVTTGDNFLKALMPHILTSAAYTSGTTAVVIVWDEDSPIPNVVLAPSVHPGTVATTTINHYSLLRATEEMLGLPLLGSASSATSARGVFHI